MPTSEDKGGKNEEDGENPDSEVDNEEAKPVNPAGGEEFAPVEDDDEPGMWEEIFNSHYDSKPYGGCHFSYTN